MLVSENIFIIYLVVLHCYLIFALRLTTLTKTNIMIITTAKGAKFDTSKPAKSNLFMILDGNGKQKMDTLKLTGKYSNAVEFMENISMIEVEHSFGVDEVNEDFLWQY